MIDLSYIAYMHILIIDTERELKKYVRKFSRYRRMYKKIKDIKHG